MTIKIGTCGWSRFYQTVPPSERKGKSLLQTYAEHFSVAEINSSFYNFHNVKTYKKWRRESPPSFEFTLKCHRKISHEERLKPTNSAIETLKKILAGARACEAKILLIQTPGSLRAEQQVFEDADKFFGKVETDRLTLAWETRGESWREKDAQRKLAELLEKHGIIHVTDPFKLAPVFLTDVAYFRLHGLPGYNLKYSYRNRELDELYQKMKAYKKQVKNVYLFFNNYTMYRDAQRLITLKEKGRLPPSPFGSSSVAWTLQTFEDWPTTKTVLLDKCGGWYCWVAPNLSMKLKQILQYFTDKTYRNLDEVEKEADRIWEETDYPSAEDLEEK